MHVTHAPPAAPPQDPNFSARLCTLAALVSSTFLFNQKGGGQIDESSLDQLAVLAKMAQRVRPSEGAAPSGEGMGADGGPVALQLGACHRIHLHMFIPYIPYPPCQPGQQFRTEAHYGVRVLLHWWLALSKPTALTNYGRLPDYLDCGICTVGDKGYEGIREHMPTIVLVQRDFELDLEGVRDRCPKQGGLAPSSALSLCLLVAGQGNLV